MGELVADSLLLEKKIPKGRVFFQLDLLKVADFAPGLLEDRSSEEGTCLNFIVGVTDYN